MDAQNPQTEMETVNAELGIFDPQRYKDALLSLTHEQLREECFKQYTMSGECLTKYRIESHKANGYRAQRDAQLRRVGVLEALLSRVVKNVSTAMDHRSALVIALKSVMFNNSLAQFGVFELMADMLKHQGHFLEDTKVQIEISLDPSNRDHGDIPY